MNDLDSSIWLYAKLINSYVIWHRTIDDKVYYIYVHSAHQMYLFSGGPHGHAAPNGEMRSKLLYMCGILNCGRYRGIDPAQLCTEILG